MLHCLYFFYFSFKDNWQLQARRKTYIYSIYNPTQTQDSEWDKGGKERNEKPSAQENSLSKPDWWDINHEPRTYGGSSESERSYFHWGFSRNLSFKMQNKKLGSCSVEQDMQEMIKLGAKRSLHPLSSRGMQELWKAGGKLWAEGNKKWVKVGNLWSDRVCGPKGKDCKWGKMNALPCLDH